MSHGASSHAAHDGFVRSQLYFVVEVLEVRRAFDVVFDRCRIAVALEIVVFVVDLGIRVAIGLVHVHLKIKRSDNSLQVLAESGPKTNFFAIISVCSGTNGSRFARSRVHVR